MGEVQFYYSAGGREVYGPVSKTALQQLLRDHIVDSNYFFCREGETEWRQLDPAVLEAEPEQMELPEPEVHALATDEPTPSAFKEWLDNFWSTWVDIMESTSVRLFQRGICGLVPILIGFILTSHYALTLARTAPAQDHMGSLCGYFAGVVAATALIVYLSGLPFFVAYRLWIRASAMLFLGLLVAIGLIQ